MTPRVIDLDSLNTYLDQALSLARLVDRAAERISCDPLLAGEVEALAAAIDNCLNCAIEAGELSPHAPAEAAALIDPEARP